MNTFELDLDLDKSFGGGANPTVRLRKGDKAGTTIVATLYDHGERFTTSGVTALLEMLLPDGEHYYRPSATYSSGVVSVELDESYAASVVGRTEVAYFRLYKGSSIIASTEPFVIQVLESAVDEGLAPAESYDDLIPAMVRQWMDDHPEITTTVADNSLTTAKYVDKSVTTAKINDSAVTADKLASNAVTEGKIANNAVTSAKIADGAVGTSDLANNAVTSAKIADGTIVTADLADGSVTTPKIVDASVTDSKLSATGVLAKANRLLGNVRSGQGSGYFVKATDAYAAPPLGLTVDGKSVQNGTPTPSSPVAINSIESVSAKIGSRNLLPSEPATINTDGGVTFTNNHDGSYTISGTATKNTYIYVTNNTSNFVLPAGTYTLSARTADGTMPAGLMVGASRWNGSTNTNYGSTRGGDFTFTHDGTGVVQVLVYVNNTYSISPAATVWPQLELGSHRTEFEPNVTTTTAIDLQGHELRSLPDGTRDELTVDADGHVTLVQRVGHVVYNGSEGWTRAVNSTEGGYFYIKPTGAAALQNNQKLMTSHVQVGTTTSPVRDRAYISNTNTLVLVIGDTLNITTADGFKTWLASNNVTVDYLLTTPVTHDLGTIALPATPAPEFTSWAVTDPSTTIALTYERDNDMKASRVLGNILRGERTGVIVSASDAHAATPLGLMVNGASAQDGTPTPSSPVAINSVESVSALLNGKNLLNIADGTTTASGISVVRSGGVFSVTGTATARVQSVYIDLDITANVPMILSSNISGTSSGFELKAKLIRNGSTSYPTVYTTTNIQVGDRLTQLYIVVANGSTVDMKCAPQLEVGTAKTAFAPHLGIVTPIDLQGHELRSLPDGTHDELTVDADGHVTLVQRVGTKSTFTPISINAQSDGTTSWEALAHSNTNTRTAMSNVAVLDSESTSNRLAFAPTSNTLYARLPTSLIGTTAQTIKAWADANMTLTYALITPVVHDLGTISLPDTPAPDLTAWAQTDPATTITLGYERDLTLAIGAIEAAIADLATS